MERNTGVKYTQVLAAGATTLGALALGTALGWSSPAVNELKDPSSYIPTSTMQGSWIGSLLSVGALIASLCAGVVIERIGRKPTMIYIALPFIAGWLLITFAEYLWMIYIGRIIVGFSGGVFSLAAPVYIGETASPSIRGRLGAFYQLFLTIGIFYSYAIGTVLEWKWLSLTCAVFPLLMAVSVFLMPESPLYLLKAGKDNEAKAALLFLRAPGYPVDEEIRELKTEVEELQATKTSFRDLATPSVRTPFVIMMILMAVQQLSGINAVIFYTKDIFDAANTGIDTNLQSIIVGIVEVVFTVIGTLLVDRAGRRLLFLVSIAFMGISIVALGIYFQLADNGVNVDSVVWLPLTSLIVYLAAFSIGTGPIPWVILGELFPPQAKGLTGAIATCFNWLLAFAVTVSFESVADAMGRGPTYFLFGALCIASFIYIFFCVPETKGKTLTEIGQYFGATQAATDTDKDQSRNNPAFQEET